MGECVSFADRAVVIAVNVTDRKIRVSIAGAESGGLRRAECRIF